MNCKSRECGKPFKRETNRQSYCSPKCQAREAYLKAKESGWRSGMERTNITRKCKYRNCGKEFTAKDVRKVYCCRNCAKYERKLVKKDDHKRTYFSSVKSVELTCGYRKCDTVFMSTAYNSKYCSKRCCDAENRAKSHDKKCEMNPPKRKNASHIRQLTKDEKRVEYVNPKMSVKWLQEAWNKVRHQYIKECA